MITKKIKIPKYPVGVCFVKKAKKINTGMRNQKTFFSNFIAKIKE